MLEVRDQGQVGARPVAGYRVECIDEHQRFLDLDVEWNRLVGQAAVAHPFLHHEWLRIWWDCFSAENRLAVLLVRSNGQLAGIAPLMHNETRMYGLRARRLQTIYNVHTPRLGFVVAPGHDGAWDALWEHIAARDDWDVLELDQLAAGSPTLARIERLADDAGLACDRWHSGDAPYIPLNGTWDDYFQGLAGKHRSNLRNRLKRLRKLGDVELETITEPGRALEEALQEGLRIEAAGWKGDEGTAIRCEDDVRDFYSVYAHAAARYGLLRLHFLKVDGERIAFAYSVVHAERLFLIKTGYDPEYSKYSPFNALLQLLLQDCYARGLEELDFLGVFDSWKERWTSAARPHHWLYVFANTPTARLIRGAKFNVIPKVKEIFASRDDDASRRGAQ